MTVPLSFSQALEQIAAIQAAEAARAQIRWPSLALLHAGPADLKRVKGLGPAKRAEVAAVVELARRFPDAQGIQRRALNQAARELMLAQASDWAFIMKSGTTVPYATKRTNDHITRFNRLYDALLSDNLNEPFLVEVERRDNLFPSLDYRVYAS